MSDAQLVAQLKQLCTQLVDFAAGCPRGGSEAWDARLAELGARRLPDEERQRHLLQGAPLAAGPLPLEFRWALEAVAAPLLPRFDDTGKGPAVVEEAMRSYLARVKPRPTTSSIFANAMATTKTYANTGAGSKTLGCETCGAPRMHGNEALVCGYCGSERFV